MTTRHDLVAAVNADIRDNTIRAITPQVDREARGEVIDATVLWEELAGGWRSWWAPASALAEGAAVPLDSDSNAVTGVGAWSRIAALNLSAALYPTSAVASVQRTWLRGAVGRIQSGDVIVIWESATAYGAYEVTAVAPALAGNPPALASVRLTLTHKVAGSEGTMGASPAAWEITVLDGKMVEYAGSLARQACNIDLHDDVTTEETTPQDDDRLAVSAEDEAGDPTRWLSLSRLANYVKNKIGNATTAVAGLMSAADKTKLDALDKEQIRIDEFIDSDNVMVIDNYSIVASYNGTVNGSSIFAQNTYSIYYQDGASTPHNYRTFLSQIKAGWQFLLHRQSTPPQYVFSDVTAVEWQDTNGDATTVLANAVTFKYWVSIDDERGLDAYGELTPGAIRLHWKTPLDETYASRTLANIMAITNATARGHLRDALPTGTSKTDGTLTTADKLLLETFDDVTIGEFVEWHDEHTPEPQRSPD